MSLSQKYYGIHLEKFNLENNHQNIQLCKLLLFNPLITAEKAEQLLKSQGNKAELTLTLEASLRNYISVVSATSLMEEAKNKIAGWSGYFDVLTEIEIQEYFDFHKVGSYNASSLLDMLKGIEASKVKNPNDIKKILDQYVIGQDRAKESICFAFYLHLLRTGKIIPSILTNSTTIYDNSYVYLPKPNMLIVGSTGTGKTFMIKTLCKLFDVPFVKIDCASLTSSGYVGKGVSDYIMELYKKLEGNIPELEKAILYFDEVDKLSEKFTVRGSVGGVEVQQEFLTLLEDDDLIIEPHKNSGRENIKISAKNLMFIFSGSFAGIESTIEKRIRGPKSMGYTSGTAESNEQNLMQKIIPQDIIEFGIIPELVGRINFVEALDPLTKDDVKKILLDSKDSPLVRYHNFFKIHLDELVIQHDVIDLIAEEVLKRGGGGRAIQTVLQQLLKKYLFKAPNDIAERYTIDVNYFNQIFN